MGSHSQKESIGNRLWTAVASDYIRRLSRSFMMLDAPHVCLHKIVGSCLGKHEHNASARLQKTEAGTYTSDVDSHDSRICGNMFVPIVRGLNLRVY